MMDEMLQRTTPNRSHLRWELLLACLLPGCASVAANLSAEKELLVYPHFASKTQAILNPNTVASIATLDIVPYVEVTTGNYSPISALTGNATTVGAADMLKLSMASPSIASDRPFIIRKLKPNKNYRVYGRAYNASNGQISLDASSFTDIAVGNNDAPAMAQLPVVLMGTSFAASTSVTVLTDGRFDSLKGTLYLVSNGTQVAISQSVRSNPEFAFSNLQGATDYRLVVEAYKLGSMLASSSIVLNITNETAPAAVSLPLRIPYVVSTWAGNGVATCSDGVATAASFYGPSGIVVDGGGNAFVADRTSRRIRKIAADGTVSTFAGNGDIGSLDGTGTGASFGDPISITQDLSGNFYVTDIYYHRIRKITSAGVVTTYAGNGVIGGGDANGTSATFNGPIAIQADVNGNLFVADYYGQRIRKIDASRNVTTIAGNGATGFSDGVGTAITLNGPYGVTVDAQGNVYVADRENARIRKIDAVTGASSTFAGSGATGFSDGTGTSAQFYRPAGLCVDPFGNIYIAERWNHAIRKVSSTRVVTTLAGNGSQNFANGTGTSALFNYPAGIALDASGILYVGDDGNQRVRKLQ